MILLDASVWIDHLRRSEPRLVGMLSEGDILIHPFVTAEVALGSIARRDTVIAVLDALPQAPVATHGEVMRLIEHERLHGLGIGYVDAHLLASARLADAGLWSRDRRLLAAAERLGVAAEVT
ncbi:VapC toxin family PIN domain ribonuclease [Bosea sp. Tri-44]|uniref:type II toxin-antitoxin system VapC family toxin n=1 Tax=Bosea sp. Tri-44 TaxID=1972137 RepID=UPI00100F02CE|nr:type II toxin-antitoxin system VapC family toxin [Bosea sp. Tri-44]RXT46281.1 VapC toxin family PIN domain ribonuclease [Bosea sp. Tri-44]